MHRWTHLGDKKLVQAVKGPKIYIIDLRFWAREIEQYKVGQQVNAYAAKSKQGKRPRGEWPGVYWEVDFTEVKPGKYGYKYLLVFVDVFPGWVETLPTKQETAIMVAKKILEESYPELWSAQGNWIGQWSCFCL